MPKTTTKRNYTIPKGAIYFDPLDETTGQYEGERWLGNCPGFTLAIETEKIELQSSYTAVREKLRDVVVQITRTATITSNDMGDENVALFTGGDVGEVTWSGGDTLYELKGVRQGRYYQLGTSDTNPAGDRETLVEVVNDLDTPANEYAEGEDYVVDEPLGRIYIVPGGAIADGANISVLYQENGLSMTQIKTGSKVTRKGRLRYIADNAEGENRDWYFPSVELGPSGELPLIGDEFTEMTFDASILKPEGNVEAVYINGRAKVE